MLYSFSPLRAEETRRFIDPVSNNQNSVEEARDPAECKVSNIFIDMDLRQAISEISTQCNIPILIDDMVHGFIPFLEMDDMPVEECLSLILEPGGFFFKKKDKYYIITSPNPISPLFNQISVTERIRPNHLQAKDILNLLPRQYTEYIRVDNITNAFIVTAVPEIIERIKKHIDKVDQAPPQVMIEALITEVSTSGSEKLGIDWYVNMNEGRSYQSLHQGSIGMEGLTATLKYTNPGKTLQNVLTTLKLLVEKGEAKIKANPKITAINGKTADIHIGKEQYYILQAPTGTYTYSRFESIKTGITLKITPYVFESGEISVTIEPEVSDVIIGEGIDESPVISKRRASTTVTVRDGQPIVIGGLQLSNESESKSGYPCIGDIPIFGLLFQNKRKSQVENEVIIIITPHIYNIEDNAGETQTLPTQGNPLLPTEKH